MNARDYREHLYQHRSHPAQAKAIQSASDSSAIYLSVVAFIAAEYFFELKLEKVPSGLMFPAGFLFFWAFYYTYYQPGHLEKTLSSENKWDLSGIPLTILSSCIWFVKIMFVELTEKVLSQVFKPQPVKVKAQRKMNPKSQPQNFSSGTRTGRNTRFQGHHTRSAQPLSDFPQTGTGLPRELTNALGIMGIPEARDWSVIQKRYRELAKKFHPDLNPDLTQAGNRFMLYDAAYRKLEAAKDRYFISLKS